MANKILVDTHSFFSPQPLLQKQEPDLTSKLALVKLYKSGLEADRLSIEQALTVVDARLNQEIRMPKDLERQLFLVHSLIASKQTADPHLSHPLEQLQNHLLEKLTPELEKHTRQMAAQLQQDRQTFRFLMKELELVQLELEAVTQDVIFLETPNSDRS